MSDRDNSTSVLFASSEVAPWSKTGGLADVCSALPKALDKQGLNVSIVTPYYRCVRQWFLDHEGKEPSPIFGLTLHAPIAHERRVAGVRRTTIPGTNVVAYFIEHNVYYDRDLIKGSIIRTTATVTRSFAVAFSNLSKTIATSTVVPSSTSTLFTSTTGKPR